MHLTINGRDYDYHKGFQGDDILRQSLNALAGETFGGLSFEDWHRQGFWTERSVPYALFDGKQCVSNVTAVDFDLSLQGREMRCVQLSTVMTDSRYRNRGLSRFLMGEVLGDWRSRCDAVYLYANDSVVDFYPACGFRETEEYQDYVDTPGGGAASSTRRLDFDNAGDRDLLLSKIRLGNPFASVSVRNCLEITAFHCMQDQKENLYYLPAFDAVAIARRFNEILHCYDIFCGPGRSMPDILSGLTGEGVRQIRFGFHLADRSICKSEPYFEEDHHAFVYSGKEDIFRNRLMLPILCRA